MSPCSAGTPSKIAVTWPDRLSLSLIGIGVGIRVYHWAQGRSLWLDEAYLAVNILERNFGELHRPLEYSQSAPWLFLLGSKAMLSLWGPSELVLRFIPLIASILSLGVFWRLARKCCDGWVVPVCVAIFAFAHQPLFYAQELKQYSLDIFLCTVVLWLTARVFEERDAPRRPFAWLTVTGAAGIFAMHAMPFLLAGAGVVIAWARWKGTLRVAYAWILSAFALWLLLFTVNYVLVIRPNYTDHVMKNYWAFAYPRLPWGGDGLREWVSALNHFFTYFGYGRGFKAILAALLLTGAYVAVRDRKEVVLAGLLACALYWTASLAGKAPFFGRLLLFLFPALVLTCGAALRFASSRTRPAVGVIAAILLLAPTVRSFPALRKTPGFYNNLREPIQVLAANCAPADHVYVCYWAQPGLRFYRQALGLKQLDNPTVHFGGDFREFTTIAEQEWAPRRVDAGTANTVGEIASLLPGQSRLWILVAHLSRPQEDELLSEMERQIGGAPRLFHRSKKSCLYFYPASP